MATDLFAISKTNVQAFLENVDEPVHFEIPILEDVNGRTPLDICLDVGRIDDQGPKVEDKGGYFKEKFPSTHKLLCHPHKFIEEDLKKEKKNSDVNFSRNIMLAGIIFDNLKDYEILHSSQLIIDSIIEATRIGLPAAQGYLESRMIDYQHPQLLESYPKLKSRFRRETASKEDPVEYGAKTAPIFGSERDLTSSVFKSGKPKEPTRFVLVDLPGLHEQSETYRGR